MSNKENSIENAFKETMRKAEGLGLRAKNRQPANDELVALLTFWHRSPVPVQHFQELMQHLTESEITVAQAYHFSILQDSSQQELITVTERILDYFLEDENSDDLNPGEKHAFGRVLKLLMHLSLAKNEAA